MCSIDNKNSTANNVVEMASYIPLFVITIPVLSESFAKYSGHGKFCSNWHYLLSYMAVTKANSPVVIEFQTVST